MVQQPVEDRGGNDLIAEQLLPVPEALVGGDDGGASFVAVADELEEQVGFLAVDGKIPHLIDHHQTGSQIGLVPGLGLLLKFSHQGVHGHEVDLEAVMTGLGGQCDRQMGFAHPRRPPERSRSHAWE